MPGSGHRSATNRALVARLEQKDTGRLRVGRGSSALRVCVSDGEIIAATSRDDLRHLLRRLMLAGELSGAEGEELIKLDSKSSRGFSALLDRIDEALLVSLLQERFVENLTRFLGSSATPRFNHLPAIFEDNIQIGHDVDALIQSCADAWDDALSLDLNTMVFPGRSAPRDPTQRLVRQRLGEGILVSRLLIQLPAEPFTARAILARMLRAHMLDTDAPIEGDDQTADDQPEDFRPNKKDDLALGDPIADEWRPEGDTPVSVGPLLEQIDPELPSDYADAPAAADADAEERSADQSPPEDSTSELDDVDLTDVTDDAPTDSGVPDSPPEEDGPFHDPEGDDAPANPDYWLNPNIELEADLEAFSDHDSTRGGADGEEGAFTTEDHNLDRVEVATLDPEAIEVGEAPVARFSAPVITEDEARDKIAVAHDVMSKISAAMDQAKGKGRGQSAVQILFDGAPSDSKALFKNLTATDEGGLPVEDVLHNLQLRPEAEHRRLLAKGLSNLIERYLSLSFEELPDESIDEVLEQVAGYSQRLGR
ncbi:MAG: hypothetical protein EA397_20165 [Deltaproteobacteria bacterium]|nr:MAG: hypothetical protein EA397_20165 [Deltaproteobacteria bacterium]